MAGTGRKAAPPKNGKGKEVLVAVPQDLALSLLAFCEAHYGASQNRVMCEALEDFITRRLEAEPQMRLRFKAAHDALTKPTAEIVRLQSTSKVAEAGSQ